MVVRARRGLRRAAAVDLVARSPARQDHARSLPAVVTKGVRLEGAAYFWFFAALMLLAMLAFRAIARRYQGEPAQGPVVAQG